MQPTFVLDQPVFRFHALLLPQELRASFYTVVLFAAGRKGESWEGSYPTAQCEVAPHLRMGRKKIIFYPLEVWGDSDHGEP